MSELSDKLNNLLTYVEDADPSELSQSRIIDDLEDCIDTASDTIEVMEVRCLRCDRRFRSLPEVKYCTKECELGGVQMPYQTREQQARGPA